MAVVTMFSGATGHPIQGKPRLAQDSTGRIWYMESDGVDTYQFWYSDDDGDTWTEDTGAAVPQLAFATKSIAAFFIDARDQAWFTFHHLTNDRVELWKGNINTVTPAITWETNIIEVEPATTVVDSLSLVAYAEGSDDRIHLVYGLGKPVHWTVIWDTSAGDFGTSSKQDIHSLTTGSPDSCDIDFHHTGDGKTVKSGTPHLYVIYNSGSSLSIKRLAWSSGPTWTPGSQHSLGTGFGGFDQKSCGVIFDGTQALAYAISESDQNLTVFQLDAADTTFTNLLDGIGAGDGLTNRPTTVEDSDILYDAITLDLYFCGSSGGDPITLKWDRGTDTWDAGWTDVETAPTDARDVWWIPTRGVGYLRPTWRDGTDFETTDTYTLLNQDPTAPTIDAPADGSTADVDETLTIDWTFNDPDTGDTQSAYTLRRRIGAGSFNYWNGTSWQASEDASTKITTSATQQTLAASWGTDGDSDHYYSVKTWDAADAGPSAWSDEHRVIPSVQDNPTLTAPANLATVSAIETATWTVTTQTKYRVVVSDTSSTTDMNAGSLEYDSGTVVSTSTSAPIEFPTNSVTRYVRIQTWNDEGLASDIDEHEVSVSYTPPSTPTLSVTADDVADTIDVDITNPGAGATETHNDIFRRVVGTSGNGIRIAANVAVDGLFTDRTPVSGVNYEYRAKVFGDNGSIAFSTWTA